MLVTFLKHVGLIPDTDNKNVTGVDRKKYFGFRKKYFGFSLEFVRYIRGKRKQL